MNPKSGNKYPILIQKQPGKKGFQYTIKINGMTKEQFDLNSDTRFEIGL
jgi:hypothetical protein